MMDLRITLNTPDPLPVLLVSPVDHVTPMAGASPGIVVSSGLGPFIPVIGVTNEIGNGWYSIPGTGNTGVAGPLILQAYYSGRGIIFDTSDVRFNVVPALGVAPLRQNQTNYPLTFLMVSAADHVTGVPGLVPTVTICKTGGVFSPPIGLVRELDSPGNGRGWYYVAGNPADTDTAGPLLLHAEAPGCDDTDEQYDVAGVPYVTAGGKPLTASLLAIRAMVINSGLFTNSTCIISSQPRPFPDPVPPCCAIMPGAWSTVQEYELGGGRGTLVLEGEFILRVIIRHALDQRHQDMRFLTDPTRGGYVLIEDLVELLSQKWLYDSLGAQVTTRGLARPRVGRPEPYEGRDPLMGLVEVAFNARVQLNLSLPGIN